MAEIRAVVLVEGVSDQVAVETLARRRGRDLAVEGVSVVPMGGATNIRVFLDRFGPHGHDVRLAGLYDAGEEAQVRRALDAAGLGPVPDRGRMAALGFHVCQADLEDELIRALGPDRVESVIEAEGELGSLRILQKQPAQRGRTREAHLHRFIGVRAGRKARYARLLVEALGPAEVPRSLDRVLETVAYLAKRASIVDMQEAIDNTVICQYRPRPGAVDDLLNLIRRHRATYTELGLATDRPEEVYIGEDQDGSGPLIVAIFQWIDAEAPRRAHQHPEIGVIWERMEALVEDRAMGPGMAFPHFETKETL